MAQGDRTGPVGTGPMSGRSAGYCAGYAQPGFVTLNSGWGRGRGPGRGSGRGRGYGPGFGGGYGRRWQPGPPVWGAPPSGPAPEQETEALRGQAEYLAQQLETIKARLAELEDGAGDQ